LQTILQSFQILPKNKNLLNKSLNNPCSDVVLKTGLKTIFEVLVLVLVLTLDGLKDLKNCSLKTEKVLRPQFLDQKDLKTFFQI